MVAEQICRELERLRDEGAEFGSLLARAVELLHESNPRFHWTGIYELYPDNVLRLGPFVGDPTDHVFIAVGNGICGTAIAERRNLHIPDVSKEDNYLACSSQTRSELVILIRLRIVFVVVAAAIHAIRSLDIFVNVDFARRSTDTIWRYDRRRFLGGTRPSLVAHSASIHL